MNRSRLATLCSHSSGRRGTGELRALLAERPLPLIETRSKLEARFLRFCRERGLPIPAVNTPLGDFVVDCLWAQQQVVCELDSWAFHGDRTAFEGDRARDVAIQRMDHRIVRITDRRIRHAPDALEADLRSLLGLGKRAAAL
jgi:very-short-patch-repair endonuclease